MSLQLPHKGHLHIRINRLQRGAAKTDGTARYVNAIEELSTEIIAAESDSRIGGFGELDLAEGEVQAVFVDPEWGGEGIGSSILDHFEQRLREENYSTVRLRAVPNAIGFYEGRGEEQRIDLLKVVR